MQSQPEEQIQIKTEPKTAFALTPAMRRLISWSILICAGSVGVSYVIFVIYWTWQQEGWIKDIIQQHFAATVGLPLASLAAFLLVTVLEISAGKVEFEALGFKFRGAAGPVVLWVITFLAITIGIRLLWQ